MVTVGQDVLAVDADLRGGLIACPGCGGRLRPWGSARVRRIRQRLEDSGRVVVHRPRRALCGGCGATHVLLPVVLAARRADGAAVIAAAIEAKVVSGRGHRAIAQQLGRPVTTVRGWLRSFSRSAGQITTVFTALVARHAPDAAALWPAPATGGGVRQALSVLSAWAQVLASRLGVVEVAWHLAAITTCHGRLFCAPWWSRTGQHELTLTSAPVGTPAWP